jgi:hypothetical protein
VGEQAMIEKLKTIILFILCVLFLSLPMIGLGIIAIQDTIDYNKQVGRNKRERPGVEIANNTYTECIGANLFVYNYDSYFESEPKDVKVFQNDSSCR